MAKKLTADTFISTNEQNKPERVNASKGLKQDFSLDLNQPVTVQNTLVTPWAGKEMIKEMFANIWESPEHDNDTLAVEFDRQSLMLILSQNGCEGIRFNFCKFNKKTTLVAFGIDKDSKLIGEEMFKEKFDTKIMGGDPPPGSEEGHGITKRQFRELISERENNKNISDITDHFFSLSLK